MTKAKFPTPRFWLDIKACKAIYKAYKEFATKFNVESPLPSFDSRYEGALESILGSVQLKSFLLNQDIAETATHYFVSLSKSQAFFDANKRMAVIITNTYLILNDHKLNISEKLLKDISVLLSVDKMTNVEESVRMLQPLFRRNIKKINLT